MTRTCIRTTADAGHDYSRRRRTDTAPMSWPDGAGRMVAHGAGILVAAFCPDAVPVDIIQVAKVDGVRSLRPTASTADGPPKAGGAARAVHDVCL